MLASDRSRWAVGPASWDKVVDGLVDGHVAGRGAVAAGWRVRPGLGRAMLLVLAPVFFLFFFFFFFLLHHLRKGGVLGEWRHGEFLSCSPLSPSLLAESVCQSFYLENG